MGYMAPASDIKVPNSALRELNDYRKNRKAFFEQQKIESITDAFSYFDNNFNLYSQELKNMQKQEIDLMTDVFSYFTNQFDRYSQESKNLQKENARPFGSHQEQHIQHIVPLDVYAGILGGQHAVVAIVPEDSAYAGKTIVLPHVIKKGTPKTKTQAKKVLDEIKMGIKDVVETIISPETYGGIVDSVLGSKDRAIFVINP